MTTIQRLTTENATDELIQHYLYVAKQLSNSVTETSVRLALDSSQSHVLIALDQDDHSVVGTATMGFLNCVTGVRAHIEDVVVDEKHRGKGIAGQLVTEAIRQAKEVQAKTIDLTSRPDREAANRLYRKLGFVQRDTNVYRYSD